MIHVIWEFRAKPDKIAEFEREYSSTGIWARLFGKSPDYKESILLRDSDSAGRYTVIDVWTSKSTYERFKARFADEYSAIDRKCEDLTMAEIKRGIFEIL